MSHGMYLWVHTMEFTNWTIGRDEPPSPHFGTMCFRRTLVTEGGVEYPSTSFGEDYGFAERALDRGFRHLTVDNTDGSFVYVRHHNTWVMDPDTLKAILATMHASTAPSWMSDADIDFFASVSELAAPDTAPVNSNL